MNPTEDGDECCCLGTFGRVTLFGLPSQVEAPKVNPVGPTASDGAYINPAPSLNNPNPQPLTVEQAMRRKPGPKPKDPSELKNPLTAGRARAEDLAPIPDGYICEWTMLEFAGGGPIPIIGCAGNVANDRHHGPDKSTLNNTVGINLHRVCDTCHNRWHALNDEFYPERPLSNINYVPFADIEWKQHDRISRATPATVRISDRWFKLGINDRVNYRAWDEDEPTSIILAKHRTIPGSNVA
jgi:hypothetical protein